MIGALKQNEAGKKAEDVAREVGDRIATLRVESRVRRGQPDAAGQAVADENTWLQKRKLVADFSLGKEGCRR